MSDKDDQAKTNGAHLILDEHRDVHRRFVNCGTSAPAATRASPPWPPPGGR